MTLPRWGQKVLLLAIIPVPPIGPEPNKHIHNHMSDQHTQSFSLDQVVIIFVKMWLIVALRSVWFVEICALYD